MRFHRALSAAVLGAFALAPGLGRADGPLAITDCSTTAGLRAAVAAGGAYVFSCPSNSGTIQFGAGESEIVVSKPVSIDASGVGGQGGQLVVINASGGGGRIFRVAATGDLTLTGGTGTIVL